MKKQKNNQMGGGRTAWKWSVRLGTIIVVALLFYRLFSVMFDTPIESELKRSNEKLSEHYNNLKGRYDTLMRVVDNILARDSALYLAIYESDPYSLQSDQSSDHHRLVDSLSGLSNLELTELLASSLDRFNEGVDRGGAVVDTMVHIALSGAEKANHIPSIQPINNPRLNLLATSFGMRINPFYKTLQMHPGVDYSVPEGTAVFATADGVVSQIQTKGHNNGLSVTINHLNGYTTSYSFLSRTYVKVGRWVRRGDLIAFTGNTGMSYGPHLHYQVMFDGQPVDPLGYMFLELDAHRLKELEDIASHAMQSLE